jgi:hypothetical protein
MQQFNKPLSLNSVLVGVYAGEKGEHEGEIDFFNPFIYKPLKGVGRIG